MSSINKFFFFFFFFSAYIWILLVVIYVINFPIYLTMSACLLRSVLPRCLSLSWLIFKMIVRGTCFLIQSACPFNLKDASSMECPSTLASSNGGTGSSAPMMS